MLRGKVSQRLSRVPTIVTVVAVALTMSPPQAAEARGGINWRYPPPDCSYEREKLIARRDHIAPEHIHRPLGARIANFNTVSNACYVLKDEYPVR